VIAFITGRWSNSHPTTNEAAAAPVANERKPTKTSSSAERDGSPSSKSTRPHPASTTASDDPPGFSSEPPFQPGKSKDWLDAQIKRGGWKDDPGTLFRMVQNFSAMDEEEISEVIETYLQIILARRDASPAELAAYPKEWLFKLGLTPAMWRYSQLNPDAAMDMIEGGKIPGIEEVYQMALANMAAVDPAGALAHVEEFEGNDLREGMEPILGTLFATDPDRVISILENYPDPIFDGERRKLAERLAADDPQKAIDFAIANIRAGRNPDVLKVAVSTWLDHHPDEAQRWIDTYTGPGHETLK
jgi:hypothetical protein